MNSNMRRHYRNHTTPGFSRAQPTDSRRKRRRVDNTINNHSSSIPTVDKPHSANLMPPICHFSPSDDSEYESDKEIDAMEQRDKLVDYRTKAPAYNLTQSMARVTVTNPPHEFPPYGATSRYHQRQQYPYSDARSFHSSSPSSSSSSPSPSLQSVSTLANGHQPYPPHVQTTTTTNVKRDHKYNPSAPYMHSLADTRVSTALRPAYHS